MLNHLCLFFPLSRHTLQYLPLRRKRGMERVCDNIQGTHWLQCKLHPAAHLARRVFAVYRPCPIDKDLDISVCNSLSQAKLYTFKQMSRRLIQQIVRLTFDE